MTVKLVVCLALLPKESTTSATICIVGAIKLANTTSPLVALILTDNAGGTVVAKV